MTRIAILIVFLLLTGSHIKAQGIQLIENKSWEEIKAIAAKEKKMIFLDAYATWCGPCIYMQKHVFTSPDAGKYFNANFINVKIDMEKGEGPELAEAFGLKAFPTLYFFSPEGKMVHKYIGALDTEDFIAMAKEVKLPENQFYTQKELALAGKLNAERFHKWIHQASDFEEDGIDVVIAGYLSKIPDLTTNKHNVIIALDHADTLTSAQMKQLSGQVDKLAQLTGASKNDVLNSLKNKHVY